MKTPESAATELNDKITELLDTWKPLNLMLRDYIAEIQRDARDGMVPAEDLKDLLRYLDQYDSEIGFPAEAGEAFDDLRAKHPNLFTK